MEIEHPTPQGIWLPLVTPFRDDALDEASLRRMLRHYATQPIDGLILAATTGEGMTLDAEEVERLIAVSAEELTRIGRRLPIFLGISGSCTRQVAAELEHTSSWPIQGYLVTCPYYTRPSQEGLLRHFSVLADATDRPILIYNIPYRTGVNLRNEAMLELALHPRIVGVKDCSADPAQSFDLMGRKPADFAVLTGEDPFFYSALSQGAEGGILASAHVRTRDFAGVREKLLRGDQPGALADWRKLAELPLLLFAEPSPAPIKHWLWREGLIDSPEVRLPMTAVSEGLAARIDRAVEMTRAQAGPAYAQA